MNDPVVSLAYSPRGNMANSMDKVASSYSKALETVGVHSEPLPVDVRLGAARGGRITPWRRLATGRYPDGRFVHATEAQAAMRGTAVTTLHVCYFGDNIPADAENRFWDRTVKWQTYVAAMHSRTVACVSPFVAAEFRRFFPGHAPKAEYVPLPFEASPFRLAPVADALWVGTGIPRKRLWMLKNLPEAVQRLILVHRPFREHPLEDYRNLDALREYRTSLDAPPPREIRWLRGLPEADLDRLYRSSRCFVATSTYEGFHAAPFEAWIRGTPTVVPDHPTYRAQFPNDPEGVFFFTSERDLDRAVLRAMDHGPFNPDKAIVTEHSFQNVGRALLGSYTRAGWG